MKGLKIFIAAALCLSLAGCGAAEAQGGQQTDGQTNEEAQKSEAYLAWKDAVTAGYEGSFLDFLDEYFLQEEKSYGVLSARSSIVGIEATLTYRTGGFFGSTATSTLTGSGIVWKQDESTGDTYILTNYHVIYGAGSMGNETVPHVSDEIKITPFGYGAEGRMDATFVGGSISRDVAVLKVEGSGVPAGLPENNASILKEAGCLTVAPAAVRAGETVYVIGNADGKGISVTEGVVSVESESLEMSRLDSSATVSVSVIRYDAAVNHGNSGGGLFNAEGDFLGIVNARSEKDGIVGFSYAIPAQLAVAIGESALERAESGEHSARHAVLGIQTRTLCTGTEDLLPAEQTFVASVTAHGACEGLLQADDRIDAVTIGGKETALTRTAMLEALLYTVRQGDIVTFSVVRDGAPVQVNVSFTEDAYFSAD